MTVPRTFVGPDVSTQPFRPALETVLDLYVAPSVNETRRINRAAMRKVADWKKRCGMLLIASGQYRKAIKEVSRFEIEIILNEKLCRLDGDNLIKETVDYLRDLKLIVNDSPKHMRKLTVSWGEAPSGMRVIVRPCE